MNNRLVRVRDSRLLVVTTLLLQTPPFWKFPRPFTLTRPLGHGIKMEFWKMSGKLVEIKEMGRGGGWLRVTWDAMVFHPDGVVVFESLDASEPAVSKT